jgi:oxygen-independent coproporphyrinogen III oxidase
MSTVPRATSVTSVPLTQDILETVSLYIHIPFCHAKCHYCDFNSYAGMLSWRSRYVQALIREIMLVGNAARLPDGASRRCRTIFLGGGTPSLLQPAEVSEILATARAAFAVDTDAEITIEANPGTLEYGRLDELHATGVTRLSMGAQSFDAQLLKWLGRIHSPSEIESAVASARSAGFTNLNLDFIFAIPGQTMDQWRATLDRAIDLAPDHLSLYSLIVEPETLLFDWVEAGKVIPADEDLAADMYLYAQERMIAAGYEQYEISNWARSGLFSQHNLTYWHNAPYIGVGAGAHSSYGGWRFADVRAISEYVTVLNSEWTPTTATLGQIGGPVVTSSQISQLRAMSETAIMMLRLNAGLDMNYFAQRFGVEVEDIFGETIATLRKWGLLEEWKISTTRHLRLTERGRLVGNEVFERFLLEEVD